MEEVMPKAEATLKYARISSRKVKIVADLIIIIWHMKNYMLPKYMLIKDQH